MDRSVAEEVVHAAVDCDVRLNQALRLIESACSKDECEKFRRSIAFIIWSLFDKLTLPIYEEHIDLAPPSLHDVVRRSIEMRRGR
jgi:hypothetical protein